MEDANRAALESDGRAPVRLAWPPRCDGVVSPVGYYVILRGRDKLWDDTQHQIDEILEDEELVDRVEGALARRRGALS